MILQNYSQQFCSEKKFSTEQLCWEESKSELEDSFDNFAQINHLGGMYLAKKYRKQAVSLIHEEKKDKIDLTDLEE